MTISKNYVLGECVYKYPENTVCQNKTASNCGVGERVVIGTLMSGGEECEKTRTRIEECQLGPCGEYLIYFALPRQDTSLISKSFSVLIVIFCSAKLLPSTTIILSNVFTESLFPLNVSIVANGLIVVQHGTPSFHIMCYYTYITL